MFNLENFYDFYETCLRAQTLLQSKVGEGGDGSASAVVAVNAVGLKDVKEDMPGIPNAER